MSITAERKAEVIKTNANKAGDTRLARGSGRDPVWNASTNLTGHVSKSHVKDNHFAARAFENGRPRAAHFLITSRGRTQSRYKALLEKHNIRR